MKVQNVQPKSKHSVIILINQTPTVIPEAVPLSHQCWPTMTQIQVHLNVYTAHMHSPNPYLLTH